MHTGYWVPKLVLSNNKLIASSVSFWGLAVLVPSTQEPAVSHFENMQSRICIDQLNCLVIAYRDRRLVIGELPKIHCHLRETCDDTNEEYWHDVIEHRVLRGVSLRSNHSHGGACSRIAWRESHIDHVEHNYRPIFYRRKDPASHVFCGDDFPYWQLHKHCSELKAHVVVRVKKMIVVDIALVVCRKTVRVMHEPATPSTRSRVQI